MTIDILKDIFTTLENVFGNSEKDCQECLITHLEKSEIIPYHSYCLISLDKHLR